MIVHILCHLLQTAYLTIINILLQHFISLKHLSLSFILVCNHSSIIILLFYLMSTVSVQDHVVWQFRWIFLLLLSGIIQFPYHDRPLMINCCQLYICSDQSLCHSVTIYCLCASNQIIYYVIVQTAPLGL